MRRATVLLAVLLVQPCLAVADPAVRVQVGAPALQFEFLYNDYGVDRSHAAREVARLGEADFLVALHLARVSGANVNLVITWRRGGMSWDSITRRCKRDGRIYFVELPVEATGPPYGRAHGYWRRHPRTDLHLTDVEIRELVLVRSVASHCKLPCAEVVRLRVRGESPRAIAGHGRHDHEDASPKPLAAKPAATRPRAHGQQ